MDDITEPMARLSAGLRSVVPETDQWVVHEDAGNVYVRFQRHFPDFKVFQWAQWLSGYMLTDALFDIEGFGRHLGRQWVDMVTAATEHKCR